VKAWTKMRKGRSHVVFDMAESLGSFPMLI
jgi:hypothetical protein